MRAIESLADGGMGMGVGERAVGEQQTWDDEQSVGVVQTAPEAV